MKRKVNILTHSSPPNITNATTSTQPDQTVRFSIQTPGPVDHLAALSPTTNVPVVIHNRYLVQIDSEKNCAFITLLRHQKLNQSQINGIFKLLKIQQIIQNECRCFVVNFSGKHHANEVYQGGLQFFCQDETEPNKAALIVVKNLEYMKNELRKVVSVNENSTSKPTIPSGSTNSNYCENEEEKIQKQRKLLKTLKTRISVSNSSINSGVKVDSSQAHATAEVSHGLCEKEATEGDEPSSKMTKVQECSDLGDNSHLGSDADSDILRLPKKVLVPSQKSVVVQQELTECASRVSTQDDGSGINHEPGQYFSQLIIKDECNSDFGIEVLSNEETDTQLRSTNVHSSEQTKIESPSVPLPVTNNTPSEEKYEYVPHLRYFSTKCYTSVAESIKSWASGLANEKALPSTNWFCCITSENSRDDVLNIYQLESKISGLSFARSIQIFPHGTLDIRIESKPCADYFMKNQRRIESLDDLVQLVRSVNEHLYCTGCNSSEEISECPGGIRNGGRWYSVKCDKAVLIDENHSNGKKCLNCKKLESSLLEQLKFQRTMLLAKKGGIGNESIKYVFQKGKVDIGKTVYSTIGSFWESLQMDDHVKAYKALPAKEKR